MVENIPANAAGLGEQLGTRPGLTLTQELIEEFLASLLRQGRTQATASAYRRSLMRLYLLLPEDKQIWEDTLPSLWDSLREDGYAPSTINGYMAAVDGLLNYCGRRDLQLGERLKRATELQPELSRREYLRLLSAGRTLGKERAYLLVKVFGAAGLSLGELPRLTVEAVHAGRIVCGKAILHLPPCLCMELTDYACREGVFTGPLFVTRTGVPLNRSNVTREVQSLARAAQVAEEKCNPRCLRKLQQATVAAIADNVALLVERSYDRLLDSEQLSIAWGPEAHGK